MKKRKAPVDNPEAPPGELFGYVRVSTDEQNLDMQIDALARAGVDHDRIYEDKKSGKDMRRVGLQDVLELMRPGDVLVVWRFDRLSRSMRDLVFLSEHLESRGIHLRSLTENLDTTTPFGRFWFHMSGALAEFERGLISFRSKTGMAAAKERGVEIGRPRDITDAQLDRAIKLLKRHGMEPGGVQKVAKQFKVTPWTLRHRVFEKLGKRLWRKGPRSK